MTAQCSRATWCDFLVRVWSRLSLAPAVDRRDGRPDVRRSDFPLGLYPRRPSPRYGTAAKAMPLPPNCTTVKGGEGIRTIDSGKSPILYCGAGNLFVRRHHGKAQIVCLDHGSLAIRPVRAPCALRVTGRLDWRLSVGYTLAPTTHRRTRL